ncbi:MAG: helix-turn-helix domain-containing protein, partial [Leptospiraceae bacterium]|nr:helix-turn-helix domain-containing protein [Leptospiraceae bacterium]
MSTKRVGQILREAREERRLTVRDVSKDTNIAIKFILALENEDYSQFPAETFAMGFLKTYSDYLKLDTAFIMNMYRGEKMEEAHAPLEELTKPTKPIVNSVKGDRIKVITIMFIIFFILFVIIIFGVFLDDSNNGSIESKTEPVEKKEKPVESEALIPKSISFSELAVPEGKYAPFIVTQEKGVRFSVGNKECRIFIKEVKESADGDVAVMGFNIFPDKYIHTFEVRENATSILSYEEPKLASLPKKVFVKAQVVTFRSAKLLFSLGQEENANTDSNISSGDVPIQLTLKFVK